MKFIEKVVKRGGLQITSVGPSASCTPNFDIHQPSKSPDFRASMSSKNSYPLHVISIILPASRQYHAQIYGTSSLGNTH